MIPGASLLRWMRARLAARPDTEHEQAIVRIAVGVVLFFYLLPGALRGAAPVDGNDRLYLAVMIGYLTFALAVYAGILFQHGTSPMRRLASACVDVGAVTFFMAQSGVYGVPMFLIYVWVTLANGFRFGQRYLLFALALSVSGFGVVLLVDDFWSQHSTEGIGMGIAFIALSFYVRSLVARMFDAVARAEAANQAKRRFISVVSHEMRTPLNAIIGMADLMRDTTLSREQADMLQTLRGSSQLMLGLVEDVLDFSKIEAGKLVLERTDFDLHALVNSTSRILQAQAQAKSVEFVVSIMPEVPPALRGDAHHLRQVLINLAGNAVKFTERGGVTMHVSLQEESETAVRLKFTVRDTGVGIPEGAMPYVFEMFRQVPGTGGGGVGLGLHIVHRLVTQLGGTVNVESAPGQGSSFVVTLPLHADAHRSPATAA